MINNKQKRLKQHNDRQKKVEKENRKRDLFIFFFGRGESEIGSEKNVKRKKKQRNGIRK